MFQKYFSLWSRENLLSKAFKRTVKMLEYDREMFEAAAHALRRTNSSKTSIDIYERDKKINKYEREVRRNVLTHLSIAGKRDFVPGLSLVSIVIDVERIGDYTKNIGDLARDHPKQLQADHYERPLSKLEKEISDRFGGFEAILID
ncbi:MAG: PhoU domain-containing protein, partial [Candidatus Zixiibacteriota bacterium]